MERLSREHCGEATQRDFISLLSVHIDLLLAIKYILIKCLVCHDGLFTFFPSLLYKYHLSGKALPPPALADDKQKPTFTVHFL